jgi:hypothetical protein
MHYFGKKRQVFVHFGVLMTKKAPFCASLRLIRTVFTRLLKKAISMALWTKAITCDKAGFKSRFCQEHQAGKNIISVNPVILSNFSSCFCAFLWLKNPFNPHNPRLINDLRSTKDYVRKNKLFMQNKANFKKVKFNVNNVLTKDYDRMDTWSIRKTKPIQSQLKPIKANSKPIKANSNPTCRGVASGEDGTKPILQSCLCTKVSNTGQRITC